MRLRPPAVGLRVALTVAVAPTLTVAIATPAAVAVDVLLTTASAAAADTAPIVAQPIVIGHRGASGYRPEHTLAAYELAIDLGADFVEPDLVSTRDGVLIARHEPILAIVNADGSPGERTTDVNERPEFADRRTTRTLDGVTLNGWWAQDFTLAEIKQLRAVERIPQLRGTEFDGQFQVPTLQEVINLVQAKEQSTGRPLGFYPETKHSVFHDNAGLSLEEPLVATLNANAYTSPTSRVFVQSFEVANLKELNGVTQVPLVQLFGGSGRPFDFTVAGDPRTYNDLATPAGLDEIATYANGIGPDKGRVIPRDSQGRLTTSTNLVPDAHARNLLVHPYTFRSENFFLPTDNRSSSDPAQKGDSAPEYRRFFAAGVDGLFSDNPDDAVAVRQTLPAPVIPEVPLAVVLPLSALATAGIVILRRRRQLVA